MLHISVKAEKIFEIYGIPVTNSVLFTLLVTLVLIILAILVNRQAQFIPRRLQTLIEVAIEPVYALLEGISKKHAAEFFPLVMTFFLFILFANWGGLVPGLAGIGLEHHTDHGGSVLTPLLRGPTADLNTTFALAIISVVTIQIYGFKYLGFKKQIGKYLNFSSPLMFFVGILELIGEFSRLISFSFRLFGNIFAGEVLLLVMGLLVPLIVPLPFLALEVFVGFIQALVFAILTAVLLGIAVETNH
jgi:F-type H+-transporting ATPase subunit a